MAQHKINVDDMVTEIRQRLHWKKDSVSGTDPGQADDTDIVRRINLKHLEWSAWLERLGAYNNVKRTRVSTSTDAYGKVYLDLPDDCRSVFQLYKVVTGGATGLVPVTMIAAREEPNYSFPGNPFNVDLISPRRYQAFIEGDKIYIVHNETDSSPVEGQYEVRYYYNPTTLQLEQSPAHESILPPEMDELLIVDTAASFTEDGTPMSRQLRSEVQSLTRTMYSLFARKDRTGPRRIKDVMGYGYSSKPYWRM